VRKSKVDASAFLLILIVVLFGAGIVFAVFILRPDPIEEALSGDRVINALFIIEKDDKPLSSFVLMYYPETNRAGIFDIPGELGLIIQQINRVDRIDTVYNHDKIAQFEGEIERLLGIEIGFYMIIKTEDLGRITDLIEGVEIFIPRPVEIYDQEHIVLFPSGVQRLDGDKAVNFVTYEFPDEDKELAVFRRQRFFLGFIKRLGEMNERLKNPAEEQVYRTLFTTGMNNRTRIRLFDEFSNIDTDRTSVQSVGGNSREVSGQTLLFPSYDGSLIKEIVRQTLGGFTRRVEGSISERVFTVEVLNGSGLNGLAGRTAELLRSFGYDVISIGNADRDDYEKTEIIDRSGIDDVVKAFGDIIRCRNIRSEALIPANLDPEMPDLQSDPGNFEYRSDFTVTIGRDFNGRYVTGE
jgi:anionic cell wall polymer biosynthesis LytR-Cps2A-Psr (LCP) family protein